jgi:hypothetical protein
MRLPRRRWEVVSVLHHRSLPEPEVQRVGLYWRRESAIAAEAGMNALAFTQDLERRRLNALAGTEYLNPQPGTWYEYMHRERTW